MTEFEDSILKRVRDLGGNATASEIIRCEEFKGKGDRVRHKLHILSKYGYLTEIKEPKQSRWGYELRFIIKEDSE